MKLYTQQRIKIILLKKKIKRYWNCMKSLVINEQKFLPIFLIEITFRFENDLYALSKLQNNNCFLIKNLNYYKVRTRKIMNNQ